MNIDFNNVRRQACFAYDALADKLNSKLDGYKKRTATFDADDIQEEMDELRAYIGAIACSYQPDDPDFKDVFSELYPGDTVMVVFNPTEGL